MKISIIIPTYNEEEHLDALLAQIVSRENSLIEEIIVTDGGSTDLTKVIAEKYKVTFLNAPKGRARQMNAATKIAKGDIFYFIHADSRPPESFAQDVSNAFAAGFKIGSYRSQFDKDDLRLKINAFCTRFDLLMMRGGDQTLFVCRDFFEKLEGFDEEFVIMEDFDMIRRARKITKFKIFEKSALIASRKYDGNNYFQVQVANLRAFLQFYFGASPKKIKRDYYKHLKLD